MVEVDIEHFIIEVKRRPVLWDSNHADYNQRHSKLSAWEEVCANLYVDWGDLSNYDKFGRVRDIQNRWKNIRDCYVKELKYERKVEKGLALAKKNKYKYSHLLEFLNSSERNKNKGSDQSSTDIEESPEKVEKLQQSSAKLSEIKQDLESSVIESDNKNHQMKLNGNRRAKRFKQNNQSLQFLPQSDSSTMDSDSNNLAVKQDFTTPKQNNVPKEITQQPHCPMETEIINNHSSKNTEPKLQTFQDYFYNSEHSRRVNAEYLSPSVEIHSGCSSLPLEHDDDKMFLLSLLPYFKKLDEERKLKTRIEMSTLLQKMIYKKS